LLKMGELTKDYIYLNENAFVPNSQIYFILFIIE